MTRPVLHIARASKPAIPHSLIKEAVRHFRNDMAPRHIRRANARKWIRAVLMLGDKHILSSNKPRVNWGTQKGIRP